MYEFEIMYKDTKGLDILFGYSRKDLAKRYPDIDPDSYVILSREYID